jgi:hypothetical protein
MPQSIEDNQISVEFGPRQAGKAHSENKGAKNPENGMVRPYVLCCERRLVLDVGTRVARIGRAEPHTRRTSRGAY